MNEYELTIVVKGSGMAKTSVKAASDYNARRLIETMFDHKVTIINVRKVG